MGAYLGIDFNVLPLFAEAAGVPESEFPFFLDKIVILNEVDRDFWQQEQKKKSDADARKKRAEQGGRKT